MDIMEQNMVLDAKDFVLSLGRRIEDSDVVQAKEYGIDLAEVSYILLQDTMLTKNFLIDVRGQLARQGKLTNAQVKATLNIFWEEDLPAAKVAKVEAGFKCYTCNEILPSWDELDRHKRMEHTVKGHAKVTPAEATPSPEEAPVIANRLSTKGLDLSNLPDGRYVTPSLSGLTKDNMTFLQVRRARRTSQRDRRFNYGKFSIGEEIVPAGTIEVRLLIGDTKELIGEQRPDWTVYRGDGEKEFELILNNPEMFAKLYGQQSERCAICGRALTDDLSRQIGLGLECEKKHAYFSTKPKSYTAACPSPGCGAAGKLENYYSGAKVSYYKCRLDHHWSVDSKGYVSNAH